MVGAIFETIAASFLTGGEMLVSAPESGEPLVESTSLAFADRYLAGGHEGGIWCLSLPLTAEDGTLAKELSFSVTAEGSDAPAPLPVSIHITQ